jgi:hypothetical protein
MTVTVLGALYLYWLDRSEILSLNDTVMSRGAYRANMPATLSHSVMELAEKEMLCFHGDLAPSFFNNEKIIESLKGQKGSLLHTQVIFGPRISVGLVQFFQLVRQGRITLYQLQKEIPCKDKEFQHFVCVDGQHVWLEHCHEPDKCADGVEWTFEPHLAEICRSYFRAILKKSKKVDPANIIDSIGKHNFVDCFKDGEWILASEDELKVLAESLVS